MVSLALGPAPLADPVQLDFSFSLAGAGLAGFCVDWVVASVPEPSWLPLVGLLVAAVRLRHPTR